MSRCLSSQCCSPATTSKKARRSEASGVSSSSSSSSYDCAYMPSESFARFSLPVSSPSLSYESTSSELELSFVESKQTRKTTLVRPTVVNHSSCMHVDLVGSAMACSQRQTDTTEEDSRRAQRIATAARDVEAESARRTAVANVVANEAEQAAAETVEDSVVRISTATAHTEKITNEIAKEEQRLFFHGGNRKHCKYCGRDFISDANGDIIIVSSDDEV